MHLIGLYIMLVMFKWGIYAVVAGNIIFSLSMCVLNARALKRATRYKQEVNRTFIIPLKAAVIMGGVTCVINYLFDLFLPKAVTTIVALVIAIVVYGVFLLKFGALTSDEIVGLPKGAQIYGILQKVRLIQEDY